MEEIRKAQFMSSLHLSATQAGFRIRLPGVWLLQDAGTEQTADRSVAFLVSVLVMKHYPTQTNLQNHAASCLNSEESEQLLVLFRILLAFLTTLETITDFTVSWLPMYGEAKLALVLYLWYPKTRVSTHLINSNVLYLLWCNGLGFVMLLIHSWIIVCFDNQLSDLVSCSTLTRQP